MPSCSRACTRRETSRCAIRASISASPVVRHRSSGHRGRIAEILGNGLHRAEGMSKPSSVHGAIGDRQDFVAVHHRMLVLCGVAGIVYHDVRPKRLDLCHSTYDFKARLRQISKGALIDHFRAYRKGGGPVMSAAEWSLRGTLKRRWRWPRPAWRQTAGLRWAWRRGWNWPRSSVIWFRPGRGLGPNPGRAAPPHHRAEHRFRQGADADRRAAGARGQFTGARLIISLRLSTRSRPIRIAPASCWARMGSCCLPAADRAADGGGRCRLSCL